MEQKKTISSVETAFDIIEMINTHGRLTLSEVVDQLDQSKSTVYYYLATLEKRNYIRSTENGYELGSQLFQLDQNILTDDPLSELAKPYLGELAEEAGFIACTAIDYDGRILLISKEEIKSIKEVSDCFSVGTELSPINSAYGKAILAHKLNLDGDETLDDQWASALREPNRNELQDEFRTIREVGFAYSDGGECSNIRSVAAPVINRGSETVLGAIGVSGLNEEFPNLDTYAKERRFSEEIPNLVKRTSTTIEHHLENSK